jgi:hypothetical protein
MKDFLSRHSYIVIWVLALLIIGSLAILIFQLNGITVGTIVPTTATIPTIPASPAASGSPAAQAAPSVTLTIAKSAGGNSLFVQWQNLPSGTVELDIFRSKTGATSTWSLWKTISITPGQLVDGNFNIDLGSSSLAGYLFYVQAGSGGSGAGGGSGDNSPSTDGETILWTSSSTVPIVTTSTPSGDGSNPGDGNPPPPDTPPASSPSSSASSSLPQNPSSTPPSEPSSSPSSTPPSNSGPGNNPSSTENPQPSPPPGNPYYNPQVQITGYGTASGDFWVEHADQSIEIGWQNIPAEVDTITVARATGTASSTNPTGPWNTIITQQNPGTSGSYSLQLVDNSLNDPYYYEMTALEGSTTIATYGPVYLAPN